jgi:hypothetical protein
VTAALAEPGQLLGVQTPRLELIPEGVESTSLGDDMAAIAADAGLDLDPWQVRVLRYGCAERVDGLFAADTVVVIVSRQNGKGGILEARQLGGLFILRTPLQVHTAHLFDTSVEHFDRVWSLIENTPELEREVARVSRAHNEEGITLKRSPTLIAGSSARNVRRGRAPRLRFKARTAGGGRGWSAPTVYFDEDMILPAAAVGAIVPIMSAMPNPQMWFSGSAGDEFSEQEALLRREALKAIAAIEQGKPNPRPRMYFAEWSVDEQNYDRDSVEALAVANPALGRRITVEWCHNTERGTFPIPAEWDRERLGVGRYPPDPDDAGLIKRKLWQARRLEGEAFDRDAVDPLAFGVAVRPDRSGASISVAWRDGDRDVLDLIDRRPGVAWVAPRVRELRARWSPAAVVIDVGGPAVTLLKSEDRPDLLDWEAGEVNAVGLPEYLDATSALYDGLDPQDTGDVHPLIAHRGNVHLTAAALGATARRVKDRWTWDRKGTTDITPLEAATLALYGLRSSLAAQDASDDVWSFYG